MWLRSLAAALQIIILVRLGITADAAEIKVWSGGVFRPVMNELGPRFERMTGHKLVIEFAASPVFSRRLDAGQSFDVAILLPETIDEWIKQGKIVANTRTNIARATLGVAIATGSPKSDISSIDTFKRTLLNAKAVSYFPDGAVGKHFMSMLDRLGIAVDMKSKLRPAPAGGTSPASVAKGEAELAVAFIPAIVGIPGVELVGALPSELAFHVDLSAGVSVAAKELEPAMAFIRLLASADGAAVIKAKGFERIAP